ncbi:MAG: hypothetical protein INF43_02510 [Alphaproteobacteria bacterium]|jgi:hypothetical protein|nr:hypothetical protein [Alphaproteobacteria bacterium]
MAHVSEMTTEELKTHLSSVNKSIKNLEAVLRIPGSSKNAIASMSIDKERLQKTQQDIVNELKERGILVGV